MAPVLICVNRWNLWTQGLFCVICDICGFLLFKRNLAHTKVREQPFGPQCRFQRSKGWVPTRTLKLPTDRPLPWGVVTFRIP